MNEHVVLPDRVSSSDKELVLSVKDVLHMLISKSPEMLLYRVKSEKYCTLTHIYGI